MSSTSGELEVQSSSDDLDRRRHKWRVRVEGRGRLRTHRAKLSTPKFRAVELSVNAAVGPYILLESVPEATAAKTVEALDPRLGRRVALEFSPANDPSGRARLELAQKLAGLGHEQIVPVLDAGQLGERIFMAMAWIEGQTLAEWAEEQRPKNIEVLRVSLGLLDALVSAHRAGIHHGGIDAGSVIVDGQGHPTLIGFHPLEQDSEATRHADVRDLCALLLKSLYPDAGLSQLRHLPTEGHDRVAGWLRRGQEGKASGAQLLAALELQYRGRSRPRPTLWSLVGVSLLLLILALPQGRRADAHDPCAGARAAADRDESPERLRALSVALAREASQKAWVQARRVSRELRAYQARWAAQLETVCDGSKPVATAAETRNQRLACLGDLHRESRALVHQLTVGGAALAPRALEAVLALKDPKQCATLHRDDIDDRGIPGLFDGDTQVAEDPAIELGMGLGMGLAPDKLSRAAWSQALAQIGALNATGQYLEATQLGETWLTRARQIDAPDHIARFAYALGRIRLARGENDRWTSELFHEALYASIAADLRTLIAEIASGLLFIDGYRAGHQEQTDALVRAAEARITAAGSPPEITGPYHQRVGILHHVSGNAAEAEAELRLGLRISREALGDLHPRVATALSNLGFLLEAEGQLSESAELLQEAIDIRRTLYGPDHHSLGLVISNLASTQGELGQFDEAEQNADWAVTNCVAELGQAHAHCIAQRQIRARILHASGQWRLALERSLVIGHDQRSHGQRSTRERPWESTRSAALYFELGQWTPAREHLERARAANDRESGILADHVIETELTGLRLALRDDRAHEAERILRNLRELLPQARVRARELEIAVAVAELDLKAYRGSATENDGTHVLGAAQAHYGEDNANLGWVYSRLSAVERAAGRIELARAHAVRGLVVLGRAKSSTTPLHARLRRQSQADGRPAATGRLRYRAAHHGRRQRGRSSDSP